MSRRQAKMSSRFHRTACAAVMAAMLALPSQGFAQSGDVDPEMRIQQLENQLRQLTGQNEELQYRNRQLEDRLRLLQGGAQTVPGQPAYDAQIPAPAPIVQEPPAGAQPPGRRRGDAFDPTQNPNAPGVPHALGG